MNILKPVFQRDRDGRWGLQCLLSVPLEREEGADTAFYPVRDRLFTDEHRYVGTIHSTIGESIVPIVAVLPADGVVRCLGTGFFVNCTGLLMTAAHVIIDPIERGYGRVRRADDLTWIMGDQNLGVMVATNPLFGPKGYIFRPIEWAGFLATQTEHPLPIKGVDLRLTSDAAICMVTARPDGAPDQPLTIIQPGIRGVGLAVGKNAAAVGYAGMQDFELLPADNGFRVADFRFDLHVSRGKVLERFPDNAVTREASTPGACFAASLTLPAGMSGSPIFDDERIYVHGVVSKGLEDENGPTNLGYGSMLVSSLSLPIRPLDGRSLLQLMESGGSGIPRFSAPDV